MGNNSSLVSKIQEILRDFSTTAQKQFDCYRVFRNVYPKTSSRKFYFGRDVSRGKFKEYIIKKLTEAGISDLFEIEEFDNFRPPASILLLKFPNLGVLDKMPEEEINQIAANREARKQRIEAKRQFDQEAVDFSIDYWGLLSDEIHDKFSELDNCVIEWSKDYRGELVTLYSDADTPKEFCIDKFLQAIEEITDYKLSFNDDINYRHRWEVNFKVVPSYKQVYRSYLNTIE